MPNLKSLKVRIASVKSTQKITKAMKMVAAAKLRRAQERAQAAEPYADRMNRMLVTLASNVKGDNAPALLGGTGKSTKHLLIVATSDRGLCGAFNSSIVRAVRREVAFLKGQGKSVTLFCIGKKGYEQLKSQFSDIIVERIEGLSKKQIGYEDAESIAQTIIRRFEQEEFDVCSIVYNKFISAISQQVTKQQLVPLEWVTTQETPTPGSAAVYEFEPSEERILTDLLPRNLAVQILHALLENTASEQGARMSAMDNATRNAGDMIKRLTLVYNRTRQAAITKELIEIISGAEAV